MDALLDNAPCGFLTLTDDGVIRQINATLLGWLGYARAELEGAHVGLLLSVSGRVFYQTHVVPLLSLHGKADEVYFGLRAKGGETVPMLVNAVRRDGDRAGEADYVWVPMHQRNRYEVEILQAKNSAEEATRAREQARLDLEEKQAQLLSLNAELEQRVAERTVELAQQQQFLRRVIDAAPSMIFVKDEQGRFTLANQAVATLYGTTTDALIGKSDADFSECPEEVVRFAADDAAVIERGQDLFVAEESATGVDGQVRWLQTLKRPLLSPDGVARHLLGVSTDITARKHAEEQLAHQAFHDTLTGLPNRALFVDRLERALARSSRTGDAVAVLFLDLDNFKVVNDSLGHEAGDALLQEVARRLRQSVRPGDTVARLGGDEFTLLLEEVTGPKEAEAVAVRIADALGASLVLGGREVFPVASIGIAVAGVEPTTPGDLLRDADTAMYHAKTDGKARHFLFDRSMNEKAVERLELEADLRRALDRGEFDLYFQPIVDLDSGQIREAEALVRWQHPTRGLLTPTKFIPIAEQSGLIVPLGRWVLREACRQTRLWRDQYPLEPEFIVSVNVSSQQLAQTDLMDEVTMALEAHALPPTCLKLEITESVMVADVDAASRQLSALRAMGVQIAIDDFGTGYSSMSYLSTLPLRTLKIDRSFVNGLDRSDEEQAIVRAIVTLAKSLGLSVICEGIETEQQLAFLQALGCDLGQGYYFSRPVPAHEMGHWLARAEQARASKDMSITGLPLAVAL